MSYWKKAPFGIPPDLRSSWPIEQDAVDPWAGDELSFLQDSDAYIKALYCRKKQAEYIEKADARC